MKNHLNTLFIMSFGPNKSSGWNGIYPRTIKIYHTAIATPLQIIFDTCTLTGLFPDKWKMPYSFLTHSMIISLIIS